ncbi:RING finger protein [Spongorhabdus nitratireducens]
MPLEFECPVCLNTEDILENREALDNVAMLPVCGHWLCQDCLHAIVNPRRGFDPRRVDYECPLCRAGFQVPAGNRAHWHFVWGDRIFRPGKVLFLGEQDNRQERQGRLMGEYEEHVLRQLFRSSHAICQQVRLNQLNQPVIPENLRADLSQRPSKILRGLVVSLLKAHAQPALEARFGNPAPPQLKAMIKSFICFGVHTELIPGIVRPPFDPRSGHLFPW